jgi:hypothetical protein
MTAKHMDIPYRELGTTGEKVSAIGIGGCGINFLDNSWDYNEGMSESRGPGQVRTLQNFVGL